ncbi:MAG: hypothetical protein U0263_37165 [Polyangiaceae bacterium]
MQGLERKREGQGLTERQAQARFGHDVVVASVPRANGGGDAVGSTDDAGADVDTGPRLHERGRKHVHLALVGVQHVVDAGHHLLLFDQACGGSGRDEEQLGDDAWNEERNVGEPARAIGRL